MSRQFDVQKTIELYCDLCELFLFQMNRDYSGNSTDLILVSKCPLSVITSIIYLTHYVFYRLKILNFRRKGIIPNYKID